ncbi:hypothetical protein BBJ28_00011342 [Nothophytophthora sp. Chile5]|nr:hypothetical protein BBJ28_00011342 [Nothophytophthora sp. Chile5]
MVETRRTSRRLQAKAAAAAITASSPATSPTRRSPPRAAKKSRSPAKAEAADKREASDESAQEIPVLDDDEEEDEAPKASDGEARTEEAEVEVEHEDAEAEAGEEQMEEEVLDEQVEVEQEEEEAEGEADEEQEEQEEQGEEVTAEAAQEEEEEAEQQEEEDEEILLMDADDGEEEEESTAAVSDEDDEDEDVEQYVRDCSLYSALLAASGLNLSSSRTPTASASSAATSAGVVAPSRRPPPSATALLKRRLVPNELDSGASQYKSYFDFHGTVNRSSGATLRADARAAEESTELSQGHAAVAHSVAQRVETQRKKSAGRKWFDFESEELTADARRDFALLRMRNYLDPKKFYKTSDHARALPKHFQMGVVIEGAHEFRSARLTKKQRRQTFTDEIMADEGVQKYTKRVFSQIQAARSGQGRKKRRNN